MCGGGEGVCTNIGSLFPDLHLVLQALQHLVAGLLSPARQPPKHTVEPNRLERSWWPTYRSWVRRGPNEIPSWTGPKSRMYTKSRNQTFHVGVLSKTTKPHAPNDQNRTSGFSGPGFVNEKSVGGRGRG
jgi:hypothetical protein